MKLTQLFLISSLLYPHWPWPKVINRLPQHSCGFLAAAKFILSLQRRYYKSVREVTVRRRDEWWLGMLRVAVRERDGERRGKRWSSMIRSGKLKCNLPLQRLGRLETFRFWVNKETYLFGDKIGAVFLSPSMVWPKHHSCVLPCGSSIVLQLHLHSRTHLLFIYLIPLIFFT